MSQKDCLVENNNRTSSKGMCNPSGMNERVAVVGGGGYVGWHIVQRLLRNGHPVAIIDLGMMPEARKFVESRGAALPPITFFRVDIREKEELAQSFKIYRPQIVFHVASYGMSGREMLNKRLIEEVNIDGVKNSLAACADSNVERLVYTSSYNTCYGGQQILDGNEENTKFLPIYKHPDHYALTKSISEQLVLAANRKLSLDGKTILRTCSLRLPGIYGPGEQRHLPRIVKYLEKGWVCFRYGEGIVDFVHIDNVVEAHVLAGYALGPEKEHIAAGQAYFINDGKPINNFEFFRPLMEGLGHPFPKRQLPFNFILFIAVILENLYCLDFVTRYNLDRYFPLLTRTEVYKTGVTHYFSIGKATKELGYIPRDPPNDLSEVVRLFKAAGHARSLPPVINRSLVDHILSRFVFLLVALVCFLGLWGRLVF
ncbi:Short-chain dehydrogenase/reductase family 42E member 1 [Hypsibius exemplaris]|uniref:Short-chain dehydrogenase/reductase family 42E member 1 n=1 Tax=Hypsibius exemplaris TaxID=2072580 RepID=A0A1W0WRW7_HYPEX|nr:Short-chain dehydrogenase/reductase family 42E member 1 [Hypsibius exemplaris]